MKKNSGWAVALVLFTLLGLSACGPASEPVLEGAWIRAMPPGSKMTAGFGTLHNGTGESIEVASFTSSYFGDVSLHRTEEVDGVSRMREVTELKLCAGESLEMAPGGYHLMLMMPNKSMAPGQVVPLELKTADGRSFLYEVPVERR